MNKRATKKAKSVKTKMARKAPARSVQERKAYGKPTKKPTKSASVTRRGAPDVIEKRKIARLLNDAFGGTRIDGRSARRRERLTKALSESTSLKPIMIMRYTAELLDLGVPFSDIKKMRTAKALPDTLEIQSLLERFHAAHNMRPECYRMIGFPARLTKGIRRRWLQSSAVAQGRTDGG